MTTRPAADEDSIPAHSEVIEVRVAELRQLFDSIDPAPFRERDLDPKVERFIVEWAREVGHDVPLALRVCIDGPLEPAAADLRVVGDAVHRFFAYNATSSRRRLRQLFRVGRISLAIGLAVVGALTGLAEFLAVRTSSGFGGILRDSLSIAGWVAMWRPLEIFLYDWWPIRAEAKLFDRLATMPIQVTYESNTKRDA